MNSLLKPFIVSVFVFSLFLGVFATEAPKIKQDKGMEGWYFQSHGSFTYYVDTKAKMCFIVYERAPGVGGAGITIVESEKLKNRDEWKAIITW